MPSAVLSETMAWHPTGVASSAAASSLEESSRVFVKNLPPNITEDMLRTHFSGGGRTITDLKLIARRRIAFIGYCSPTEAAAAVRYFHRSYIRMSKLSVEQAKPISDPSLPTARKMQRLHEVHTVVGGDSEVQDALAVSGQAVEAGSKKRTRNDVDADANTARDLDAASNPKLREFLQAMKPLSQARLSSTAEVLASANAAAAAAEAEQEAVATATAAEAESDNEYESLPVRPTKKAKRVEGGVEEEAVPLESNRQTRVAAISATAIEEEAAAEERMPARAPVDMPKVDKSATDDDWLLSRTNRLLDLLDPSELAPPSAAPAPQPHAAAKKNVEVDIHAYNDNADCHEAVKEKTVTAPAPVPAPPTSAEGQIRKTARLFVRNLPYRATEADLHAYFATFGIVTEVNLPITNTGVNKGFAMVLFADPEVALAAFHNADGKTFQGRILHVLPAKAKKTVGEGADGSVGGGLDEFALAKLPLKQQRLLRKKAEAATSTFAWNSLFMSQDAVNAAVAERLGMSKAAVLDPTSSDEAVKQAIRQTSIVQETKDYFESNGVDLESFQTRPGQLAPKRGDRCLLVKNVPYGMLPGELRTMFEEYGPVVRVLMPPSGTTAIVQYAQAAHGRLAYVKMAYRRVKESVLLLEKCPDKVLSNNSTIDGVDAATTQKKTLLASDLLETSGGDEMDVTAADEGAAAGDDSAAAGATSSVFVRNLNFTTTREQLATAFSGLDGFVGAQVKTKPDPKRAGEVLSMGYGFVEFRTATAATAACKAMDGHILQGHTLAVRASHRGAQDAAEAQRSADRAKKLADAAGSKLVVKNVPFEATRKDLRALLGTYGQLKALRMPKKVGGGHGPTGVGTRGYAFAEFVTPREAANAISALRNTHLLGRRLVLEFAAADTVDPEEELERMQKKMGTQVNTVALQQLTKGRSQRSKVHIGEEMEEM